MNKNQLFILVAVLLVIGLLILFSRSSKESESSSNNQDSKQTSGSQIDTENDPIKGSDDAPVTIVEFSDFQCPYCASFFKETFPQIEEAYINTGKVKFVFKNFVLSFHENAQKAAEAAECAHEQGKFWQYHDQLFEDQDSLDVASLKKYAQGLNLDSAKFDQCLDSGKMTEEVKQDVSEGQKVDVKGTPTFFINGKALVGALPFEKFKELIDPLLSE